MNLKTYEILQLKDTADNRPRMFRPMRLLLAQGLDTPRLDQYKSVYIGNGIFTGQETLYLEDLSDTDTNEALELIFTMFNVYHPMDFQGHSLSVGDVVALKTENSARYFFVEDVGFKELPAFAEK